jgi:GAF domain
VNLGAQFSRPEPNWTHNVGVSSITQRQVVNCGAPMVHDPRLGTWRRRETTFTLGTGLPGRVWASGRPQFIADVLEDGNFPRAPVAAHVGLHAAFGFPVVLDTAILGVMESIPRGAWSVPELVTLVHGRDLGAC